MNCLVIDLDKALCAAFRDGPPSQRCGNEKQLSPGVVPEEKHVQHRSLILLFLFGEERGNWWRWGETREEREGGGEQSLRLLHTETTA